MFKSTSSKILALVSGIMILGSFIGQPIDHERREALILQGVLNFINVVHYDVKPIDDDLSKYVFDKYLESLDSGKRFLIASEIDQLKQYEKSIDDQINATTFEFFDESVVLIDNAFNRAKLVYEEVIDMPIDFSIEEEIELDNEKKDWAKNETQLKDFWRKTIKYNVMTRVDKKLEDQESEDYDGEVKVLDSLIAENIVKVKDNYERWFERLDKVRRSDRFESYIGSITRYFDPHTNYFNPKEKEDFDINMGGKLEGIGARLQSDGDYTKVTDIIPGGPAWKGKELEVDDRITKVRQENEEEAVNILGMRIDDVVQKIRGEKGTTVILTVKKKDGTYQDISIVRDIVDIDDSKAKSLILNHPGAINNVGYIKLPKFYSSFEKKDGNSCAVDVAEEIKKLKGYDVNGIILDLRNNTGGSLNDVVDMSGLFIEDGPIVQVKPRGREPYVHADTDKEVLYDGPLIVMVNNISASASEILAAALQDYGRAVIVGGKTFGKGTVQRFYNLDRAFKGANELKPLGNIKMTMQKFFRVNGGSTQLRGVTPDIELPDNFKYIEYGEREYDNALAFTEIDPQEFNQDVVELNHIEGLIAKSKMRVEKDEQFQLIDENAKRVKENRDLSTYSLNLDMYRTRMDQLEKKSKKFDGIMKDSIPNFHVENLNVDYEKIMIDESVKAKNDAWVEEVKKDIYLEESLYIMKDMIELEESFAYLEKKVSLEKSKMVKP
jgi:carboxyl-terminal processing protease